MGNCPLTKHTGSTVKNLQLLLIPLIPLVILSSPGYTQDQLPEDLEGQEVDLPLETGSGHILQPVSEIDAKRLQARRQLQQIQQSLIEKRALIDRLRGQLEGETDNLERQDLQRQIDREETDLNNLRRSFENIALGGVDLSVFNPELQQEQFNWQQELQLILKPLFQKLKDLTEKPRQIERLENQLAALDNQQRIAQRALNNVDQLLDDNLNEDTLLRINTIRQTWIRQLNDIQREREINQLQLDVLLDDGDTILQ